MPFKIIRDNIIHVKADAIVNTANPEPLFGGGTDSAIYIAAGKEKLLAERQKIGTMEVGQATSTSAFALPAKHIIHTVGPIWDGGSKGELEQLRKCYDNCLELAGKLECKSIAFPLISTGVYGFPKAEALKIAVSAFSEFLLKKEMEIILVVFDKESFVLSERIYSGVDAFIADNYVTAQLEEEYRCDSVDCMEAESYEGAGKQKNIAKRRERFSNKLSDSPLGSLSVPRNDYVEDFMGMEPPITCKSCLREETMKIPSLDDRVRHLGDTWQETLIKTIDDKGYTDTEVYKRANIDRKLFSKIRSNRAYQPKKITAVALALALKLNLDDTKDFIGRAGYAFSPSSIFDLIIEYFIEKGVYDHYTINLALFEHDQPLLGE